MNLSINFDFYPDGLAGWARACNTNNQRRRSTTDYIRICFDIGGQPLKGEYGCCPLALHSTATVLVVNCISSACLWWGGFLSTGYPLFFRGFIEFIGVMNKEVRGGLMRRILRESLGEFLGELLITLIIPNEDFVNYGVVSEKTITK